MFMMFLVGTAGSGKSLLTAALEDWLVSSEISVAVVNLDPGVESPPYTSDVDIRNYVDYGEIVILILVTMLSLKRQLML